jgi:hypothetical protein
MIQLSHINKTTKKANKMQTKLDKLNKQLLIGTEISVLIRQSTKLIEIVNANQDQVNKLKRQSDKLKAECDDKASANNFFESRL